MQKLKQKTTSKRRIKKSKHRPKKEKRVTGERVVPLAMPLAATPIGDGVAADAPDVAEEKAVGTSIKVLKDLMLHLQPQLLLVLLRLRLPVSLPHLLLLMIH